MSGDACQAHDLYHNCPEEKRVTTRWSEWTKEAPFPCIACGTFNCQLGEATCEMCMYGHISRDCPKAIEVSTYAERAWIHGDCMSKADPNEWKCDDCNAWVGGLEDHCPYCAQAAEKRVHDTVRAVHERQEHAAKLKQVGGEHYIKYAIQPWDIIDCYGMSFYEGSALKYLLRYRDKNGVEDLKKARHYIDKLIEGTE